MESLMERMYREVGEWMREVKGMELEQVTSVEAMADRDGETWTEVGYLRDGRERFYQDDNTMDVLLSEVNEWQVQRAGKGAEVST